MEIRSTYFCGNCEDEFMGSGYGVRNDGRLLCRTCTEAATLNGSGHSLVSTTPEPPRVMIDTVAPQWKFGLILWVAGGILAILSALATAITIWNLN